MTDNTFTLDDIIAAARTKYADVTIPFGKDDSVRLLNPLRLPSARRARLVALQEDLKDEAADQAALLEDGIRIVAENEADANRMLKIVDGDLTVLAMIFERYTGGTQAGEA